MIIIGEKINATSASVRAIIDQRDEERLVELAGRQIECGAHYVDVNVATGTGTREDEIASMSWAVATIVARLDTPIAVDSADAAVLEAGLKALGEAKSLVNSAKAEPETLEAIVGLTATFKSKLVGLAMDESGIPPTVEGRVAACERIATACEKAGIPLTDVLFDPLVLPVSADTNQGMVTLRTIESIKERFPGAGTVAGLSNVSFGLPGRSRLNAAFLQMAVAAGLDAAIGDPLDEEFIAAVKTAEVLVGKDRHCRRFTRAFRK